MVDKSHNSNNPSHSKFFRVTFLAERLSQPTMEDQETLGHLIYNFTLLLNFTIHQIAPSDLTYQVKIVLPPRKGNPLCFT